MVPDNTTLAMVPGDAVASGSQMLPDAATATEETMMATVDAAHAGRVTITYQRKRYRHGKSVMWFWRAVSAVKA